MVWTTVLAGLRENRKIDKRTREREENDGDFTEGFFGTAALGMLLLTGKDICHSSSSLATQILAMVNDS